MNNKEIDFIHEVKRKLENNKIDFSKPIIISQRAFMSGVRSFFNYKTDKAIKCQAKNLVKEGLFELTGGEFTMTELAKKI